MITSEKKLCVEKAPFIIEIIDHSPFIDIIINYNEIKFKLLAKYSIELCYADIQDIIGNNFYTGFQCKGIGTLLVNTAVQYFQLILPDTADVTGKMSDVGDPREQAELEKCRMIRNNFWKSFGFEILPGTWGYQNFKSKLGKIKLKSSGSVIDSIPRLIPLSEFK